MLKKKFIYRTVTAFVSVAVLIMVILEAVALFGMSSNYEAIFLSDAEVAVKNGFADNLQAILGTSKREFIKQYELENLISSYSNDMGLNNDRKCYILSVPGGEVIAPAAYAEQTFEKTENLINALDRRTAGNNGFRACGSDGCKFGNQTAEKTVETC